MPFWRRDGDKPGASGDAARDEQSRQSLEQGGLPVRAQERIAQIRHAGDALDLYSSDLSVDELAFLGQAGYAPLGLVVGSSVFHVGWSGWSRTGEMSGPTVAMQEAATLAIGRMLQEARGMGAVGVVGVHLRNLRPDWAEKMVEVVVIGTAIRVPGATTTAEPFTSSVSVQEFCSLLHAGSRPVSLVFGTSTHYIYGRDWGSQRQQMSWYNQEMVNHSRVVRETQRAAFGRMQTQAQQPAARGIVGVKMHRRVSRIEIEDYPDDYVVEYIVWGTAISEAPADARITRPSMLLNLEDLARPKRETSGAL